MTVHDYVGWCYFPVWSAEGRYLFTRTFSEHNTDDRIEDGIDWWEPHTGKRLLSFRFGPAKAYERSAETSTADQESDNPWGVVTSREEILRCLSKPCGQRVAGVYSGVSEDGRFISTSIRGSRQMQIWDTQTSSCVRVLEFPERFWPEGQVVFSPDGNRLATMVRGAEDGTACVQVWDIGRAKVLATLDEQHSLKYFGSMFSMDGKRFIALPDSDDSDGNQRVWDTETGHLLASRSIDSVAPDGYRAARWSRYRTIIVDPVTDQILFDLPYGGGVSFFPDSQSFLASTGDDGTGCYARRRPEYWWGVAWLPESWVALFSGGALLVIAARNLRRRFARPKAESAEPAPAEAPR
jgi:WD40 repeat protein